MGRRPSRWVRSAGLKSALAAAAEHPVLVGPAELAGKRACIPLCLLSSGCNKFCWIDLSVHLKHLRVMLGTSLNCLIKGILWFALPVVGNSVFSNLQNDSKANKVHF